jgi:CMP/dCMP kinase
VGGQGNPYEAVSMSLKQNAPYVLTISRQIGSGGAYIGQRLARKLGISYIDREILHHAAQRLNIPEKHVISRDERVTPAWRSLLQSSAYSSPYAYVPPRLDIPSDEELYRTESDVILDIAKQDSAVIIGRAGYYVLRDDPRHLSIFLHAAFTFRQQRVQELYHVSSSEASKMIRSSDGARASYLRVVTGEDWKNATQCHISLDTGALGLKLVENIILLAVHQRFG